MSSLKEQLGPHFRKLEDPDSVVRWEGIKAISEFAWHCTSPDQLNAIEKMVTSVSRKDDRTLLLRSVVELIEDRKTQLRGDGILSEGGFRMPRMPGKEPQRKTGRKNIIGV